MGVGSKIKRKAIFLDRDGVLNKAIVINGKPYPPSTINELEILEGVYEGIELLRHSGYKLIVITNQPDVARGLTTIEKVNEINNSIIQLLNVDEIICCFHDDSENCECRKPKPGMILEAVKKWEIDLSASYLIGDRWRDIQTAKNIGLTSILIKYDYDEKKINADFECFNLEEAADLILKIY
jgi:D-glycero-D-manno-heptose 1,7-bisphosphate phosphatase